MYYNIVKFVNNIKLYADEGHYFKDCLTLHEQSKYVSFSVDQLTELNAIL